MDQSIGPVQESQSVLVTIHEPLLNVDFFPRKKEAENAELLEVKHGQTMRLGDIDDLFRKNSR